MDQNRIKWIDYHVFKVSSIKSSVGSFRLTGSTYHPVISYYSSISEKRIQKRIQKWIKIGSNGSIVTCDTFLIMIYYYGLWFLGGGKIIQLLDLIVFDTVVKYKLRQKLDKNL